MCTLTKRPRAGDALNDAAHHVHLREVTLTSNSTRTGVSFVQLRDLLADDHRIIRITLLQILEIILVSFFGYLDPLEVSWACLNDLPVRSDRASCATAI